MRIVGAHVGEQGYTRVAAGWETEALSVHTGDVNASACTRLYAA